MRNTTTIGFNYRNLHEVLFLYLYTTISIFSLDQRITSNIVKTEQLGIVPPHLIDD